MWKQFYILYWWFEPSESLWIWKFWNSNQTHYMFSLWLHIWMQAFSSDAVPSRDQNLHPPKWLVTPFFPIPFMSYTFSYLLSFGEKWFPFILTLVFYLKKRTIFFFFSWSIISLRFPQELNFWALLFLPGPRAKQVCNINTTYSSFVWNDSFSFRCMLIFSFLWE